MIKFIVAVLSALSSSLILTLIFYNPSFGNGFPLFLVITGAAFLVGGIPCSLVIDKLTERKGLKFLYMLIAGFLVSILVILIFILMFISNLNIPSIDVVQAIKSGIAIGLYGATGAIIFYVFELLLLGLKKKLLN